MLPYLVALLTAGLPFLLLDYAIGHRHRGSAPLSFARLRRRTEGLGWWQVGICFVIAVYYAAVIAWALRYTLFSLDETWGADPEGFFFGEFLQAGDVRVTTDVVPGVLVPLVLVWLAVLVIMALGVQRGIGAVSLVFIPVLVLAFVALVVQALLLPGAGRRPRRAVHARLVGTHLGPRLGRRVRPDLLLAVDRLRHHDHVRLVRRPSRGHDRLRPRRRLLELRLRTARRHRRVRRAGLHGPGRRGRRSAMSPATGSGWRSSRSRRSSARPRPAPSSASSSSAPWSSPASPRWSA